MKEVDTLIYQRLINDAGLIALLEGETKRCRYAFQPVESLVPQLTFYKMAGTPGLLTGDYSRTLILFYQFDIYAKNYVEIHSRLRRLFDGHVFTIPGSYVEAGQVSSVLDAEGTENFDEGLEVNRKDVRYRFFVVPMAQDPI